ncbi:AP2/ERF and B3 domain-containing transcription repressor like [Actinidia chinensis var. chinensis]|uniref:AP2/ERF and B3 domain-containing transcription repressor like n=1 Tax=Actinidia chinensis var. chinensis TaxID=1590841 RepID=A0A2R6QSJ8_ACTCC|nr:AP2/ERF and B3 domain-containing transcription repressor like [Actinidia chinensis var. chinensis]
MPDIGEKVDTGPSDKEGKLTESSEVKEEEEKAMNVSEQNPSSSSPSSTAAADTAASDKRTLEVSGQKNAYSPSKKQKQDQSPGNVNAGPKLGHPYEWANKQAQSGTDDEDWPSDTDDEDWSEPPDDSGFFETEVPCSNRLLIPTELAMLRFPPLSAPDASTKPQTLLLTDPQGKEWYMPVIHYQDENAFMFARLWPEFVKQHNLKTLDWIRFYEPAPRLHTNHYVVEFVRSQENSSEIREFRTENFLFRLELSLGDVGYKRLFIPTKDMRRHFPAINIPRRARKTEIMKFTDAHNKDWYMDVMRYNLELYMIIEGWDGFVEERNLKALDVIKFYNPVHPSHGKHFLIECVKNEGEPNRAPPGSTKNEGDGKQGDHGGLSHRRSYKGKEIAVG